MVTFCNLAKIDTQEAYYSYFNGGLCSIRFLFDHGLCFESFLEYWSTISYYTLHRYHSNHHLLLLSTSTARFMEPRPFQFHGMWIQHPSFMDLVCTIWLMSIQASLMRVVFGKLKALKSALQVWNIEVFGNLDQNIQKAYSSLTKLQNQYDDDSFFEELLNLESNVHANLDRLLHLYDSFI